MRFFIDGYNLMHALGLVRPKSQRSLAKCRSDFCAWIRRVHRGNPNEVTVVFDGQPLAKGKARDECPDGPHVVFSRGETADDLLERMVRDDSEPTTLTLVSNDRRLRRFGKGRRCIVWSCEDYLDWAMSPEAVGDHRSGAASEKPVNDADADLWKREFSDLDNDPHLRRFNQVYRDFGLS